MSTPRVVVTDAALPDLDRERTATEANGGTFESFQCKSAAEVAEAVRGASMAVVQFATFDKTAIDGLAPGAAVVRYGIGFDNIDVAAATARGIPVGYVPDYCPDEVAEHTCASLLALLRKLPHLDASVRRGEWQAVAVARPMRPFSGYCVGFFGFGQIGRQVHARLKGFGFRFAIADPALDEADARELGAEKLRADELFRTADAISMHVPANEQTIHFIDSDRLRTMQPHAVIVNTARGALIDEAALADALSEHRIAGAALDVFEAEPLAPDSPLLQAPGLLLTPHAAWYSDEAIGRLQGLVAQDIANHLTGRPLRRPVPGSMNNGAPS